MYTWEQMLNATPINIRANAQGVQLRQYVDLQGVDPENKQPYIMHRFDCRDTDGLRRVAIKRYDPSGAIWIHCDCPWFQYNCEVALALRGSSSVVNSNGQIPKVNNPTLKPMVCKHSIRAILTLAGQGII